MRVTSLSVVLACLVGLLAPSTALAQAPNYAQDFSANFPIIDPETSGFVTIILTNEDGDSIVPYADFPIPSLPAYTGRHQFGARTGGADSNQEVSGVTSTYSLDGSDTVVTYDVDPFPETGGNGAYEPQEGFDEGLILLSEDGIGGVQSAVAWDEAFDGAYDAVQHDFAFRISGVGDPVNDQADGIGWSYLSSEANGTTGVEGPGTSEEPNYTGSLGVGFDIWDNGGTEGGNSISVHFDGTVLESIPIDDGTTDPNTGEEWAFNSFETDELIQASIIVTPGEGGGITQPELIGGSQYSIWNRGGQTSELIQVGGEGSTEGYLRVVRESGGTSNVVAFDYDGSEATSDTVATFNFRGLTEEGTRADGMSFLLVPIQDYDETGADLIDFGPHEEPNLIGALGVGFDTFNSDGDAQDDPEGMADVGNHISVHFDGEKLAQFDLDISEFDLVTDDADVWHTAEVFVSGDQLTVVVTNGANGEPTVVFEDSIDGLGDIGIVRPAFAARTGGAFDHYEIDNFTYNDGTPITNPGDYNANGVLDAGDLDLHASEGIANQDLTYDANNDGVVDVEDRVVWTNDLKNTWMGDADLNGVFDSSDFVIVFGEGKYETGQAATWGQGDWNGDQLFDSGDFVAAFGNGGYEMGERPGGPNPAAAAIPEPSSIVLLLLGSLLMLRFRKS